MKDITKYNPMLMMMAGQQATPPQVPQVHGGFFLTDHIKNAKAERILKNVTLNADIMEQYARGVKFQIEAMQNMSTAPQQISDFNDQLTHNKNMRDLQRLKEMYITEQEKIKTELMTMEKKTADLEFEKMKKELEGDIETKSWS